MYGACNWHGLGVRSNAWSWSCLLSAFAGILGGSLAAQEQPAAEATPVGQFVTIEAPITDRVHSRVHRVAGEAVTQAAHKGQRLTLIFELQPGRTDFGRALDMARFISGPDLQGAHTVAFIPKSIQGHSVLLALACDEIVMADEATLGNAGADERQITDELRTAYREIARRRRTVHEALVEAMLDPASRVHRVVLPVGTEFVLDADLAAVEKQAIKIDEVKTPGEPGIFSGGKGSELGFVKLLANDRVELIKAYDLPRTALAENLAGGGGWRTARIDLRGALNDGERVRAAHNLLKEAVTDEKNFICFWLDTPGGDPAQSLALAGEISNLDPTKFRTVAFIPTEARTDAALIALACDHIVMLPGAIIGGSGAASLSDDDILQLADSARSIATKKLRSPSLAASIYDPDLEVYRYERRRVVQFVTLEEATKLPQADEWRRDRVVKPTGKLFQCTGTDAFEDYELAWGLVNNLAEFKAMYGLEKDPTLMAPGWADSLVDTMRSPWVGWMLLAVGFVACWAELNVPAVGLGWLVGGLCFLLFFWSSFLGGTAGWLEAVLFLAGVTCLALEIFVLPGFGLFGLTGGILILTSLILASQTFILPHNEYQLSQMARTVSGIAAVIVVAIASGAVLRAYMPHSPFLNKLLLDPPTEAELAEAAVTSSGGAYPALTPGMQGVATTRLVPGGKALFGQRYVDVIAEGEYLERGALIVVMEVRGNRVVVKSDPASVG